MTNARDHNPVRLRRETQGLLLVELAARIGRPASLVSMIEGGYVPKLKTMVKIADALGCTPLDLWPAELEEISQ